MSMYNITLDAHQVETEIGAETWQYMAGDEVEQLFKEA